MKLRLFILFAFVCALVLTAAGLGSGRAAEARPAITAEISHLAASHPAPQALPDDSLMFIENIGQFAEEARFQVRGGDRTIWLAKDAIWITLLEPAAAGALSDHRDGFPLENEREEANRSGVNIRLSFVGANLAPLVHTSEPLTTTISYFLGNDPTQWRPDVSVWGSVRYADLYPGLDLELVGQGGTLAPRLVCHATDCAAALANVQLAVAGAEALALEEGYLQLHTAVGNWQLPLLAVVDVSGRPVDVGAPDVAVVGNVVRRPYMSQPLPAQSPTASPRHTAGSELLYATFLGGSNWDIGQTIAVDSSDSAYIAGYTRSSDFPTTPGAFDGTHHNDYDVFVARLDPTGSNLLYATFLGGSDRDSTYSIALDSSGSVYITGMTASADFPTTPNAFDITFNGGVDAFVARLNPAGSDLLYATFLGGMGGDAGRSIAIDASGSAYIVGSTESTSFPTTPGAYDTTFNGGYADAFVARLNPAGSDLLYATFLGGVADEGGDQIALDDSGSAYISGRTNSSDFPTTPSAFDSTHNGNYDVFVARLNPAGSDLLYATFLGGTGDEDSGGIALGGSESAYIIGRTNSADFPTTLGAYDTTFNGDYDAFIAKLDPTGSSLLYATFLGGASEERGSDIVLDSSGSAYISGSTSSSDFPTTPDAFDTTLNGGGDVFVARLDPAGSNLLYATFLGGAVNDSSGDLALDSNGNVYTIGQTSSSDFPTTPNAFDTTFNGEADVFVARLALDSGGGSCPVPYFSQRDPEWINHPLRTSGACSANCSTVGTCGCTLTAATMLFAHYGAEVTPPELSDCMWAEACPFSWGTGATCSQGYATWVNRYKFSWAVLEQQLNWFNRPVILGMHRDGDPNDTHWVLVISGQGSDPAGYTVHDPWPLNGANTSLGVLARNNYVFDSISVYSGDATCTLPLVRPSHPQVQSQPAQFAPAGTTSVEARSERQAPTEVSGSAWLYHMTEVTMTVQLSATSSFGEITEMQVWTDANPNPVWQPFADYVWLEWFPEQDTIHARFRDEFGNESGIVSDTTHPVYSPPPESPVQHLWLPLILKP